jgi:hypothetical protein
MYPMPQATPPHQPGYMSHRKWAWRAMMMMMMIMMIMVVVMMVVVVMMMIMVMVMMMVVTWCSVRPVCVAAATYAMGGYYPQQYYQPYGVSRHHPCIGPSSASSSSASAS